MPIYLSVAIHGYRGTVLDRLSHQRSPVDASVESRTRQGNHLRLPLHGTSPFRRIPSQPSYDASPEGSRPSYVYYRANIISPDYEELLNDYIRQLDRATSTEIIVFTIPGFIGHCIMKDGIEIHDRDSLSNFIALNTINMGIPSSRNELCFIMICPFLFIIRFVLDFLSAVALVT